MEINRNQNQSQSQSQKQNQNQNDNSKFYRFQVFQGDKDLKGAVKKTKSIGMAYLKDGQSLFTLRLWTFVNEKFYLILNQNDASKYLIMTRGLIPEAWALIRLRR